MSSVEYLGKAYDGKRERPSVRRLRRMLHADGERLKDIFRDAVGEGDRESLTYQAFRQPGGVGDTKAVLVPAGKVATKEKLVHVDPVVDPPRGLLDSPLVRRGKTFAPARNSSGVCS